MVVGESLWIFGYGSLIWRPDFPYERRWLGYIKGYRRRFHQLNVTHRGTPENPGRVVTIIPTDDADARVWGYAYEIVGMAFIEIAKKHLFDREVTNGGYSLERLRFYSYSPSDENSISQNGDDDDSYSREVLSYIADTNSDLYSDNATINMQALEISTAIGWCGPNSEYLFNLINFMRNDVPMDLGLRDDSYLFELGRLVKLFLEKQLQPIRKSTIPNETKTVRSHTEDSKRTDLVVYYLTGHKNELEQIERQVNYLSQTKGIGQ